ncbi:MFS transporter [Solidesulfovibrio sp.]|uniref:MFS transporter n=1 Tax=Solidesulfovibrio sp. TaxID=2910990 RepID=UPI0026368A0C|nr:MFS transporter [Solidesulfovibrio sp.]
MKMLILLGLLSGLPALSTDMYLPAIPTLQTLWGISLAEANISVVAFFICFSLCLLVHGPLSDRIGRRPVLLWGLGLYVASCFACALADSIWVLIAGRATQAVGAAAAAALSLALAKDLYSGVRRQRVLASIGVIMPLCPMIAPMIGGELLLVMSWRGIFVCQGATGLLVFLGCLGLEEPLDSFTSGGFWPVIKRYGVLFRNTRFIMLNFALTFMGLGYFGFVGGSSSIYINGFGVSEQAYGFLFGLNGFAIMAGSLLSARLCASVTATALLRCSLAGMAAASTVLAATGGPNPTAVALCMFGITVFYGMSRPISNHLLLELVQQDVGAAAALMTFSLFVWGAVAMLVISCNWESKAGMLGWLGVLGAGVPLLAVLAMRRPCAEPAADVDG